MKINLNAYHTIFKQWGKKEFNVNPEDPTIASDNEQHAKGGCQLNGKVYRSMPKRVALAK